MHRFPTRLAPVALFAALAALAACSKPADADATPIAADAAGAATTATADAATADTAPERTGTDTAASGFVLDMDKVDAYYATIAKISAMAKNDPSVSADQDGDGEEDDPIAMEASESIDAYIARLEADPRAKRLVTSAGMSASDFAHTNAAMLEGMMTAGMMEATGKTEVPPGINPQYVEFARTHKDELAKKMQALQAQLGGE